MTSFTKHRAGISVFVAIGLLIAPAIAQDSRHGYYTPPALDAVRPVAAKNGMVVAQERIAAEIGRDVMARGGNAVDAAVATGFAMAVTYPRAGNLGGGGFMMIHLANSNQSVAIDYRESAPAASSRARISNPISR